MTQFYCKRTNSRTRAVNTVPESNGELPFVVKCAVVGDGTVGKTSLLISYTTEEFPNDYIPTIFDKYEKPVLCDGHMVTLELCDTTGQDELGQFRSMIYPDTDVFIVCFSVVSNKSLQNVVEKWIPEIKAHLPTKPIMLVGTKSDLRPNLEGSTNEKVLTNVVRRDYGQRIAAKLGAFKYLECSAKTQIGINQVFNEAVKTVLKKQLTVKKVRKCIVM